MSVRCSHDSMCLLCPAESWERSDSHCDVNRHSQQCQLGGYPRSKKTEWKRDFFYIQNRDGQIELTVN